MPVKIIVTAGTVADSAQALELIEGIEAEYLMADKGYDADAVVSGALECEMAPVMPPRSNRREQRKYHTYLYRHRHLVANSFNEFKQWRGVGTRFAQKGEAILGELPD